MRNKMLKATAGVVLAVTAMMGASTVAEAATVYYKGSAVSWDHGRS